MRKPNKYKFFYFLLLLLLLAFGFSTPAFSMEFPGEIDIPASTTDGIEANASSSSSELLPPPAPQCASDGFSWQQTIDVNNLDQRGFPQHEILLGLRIATTFEIPGPLPAEFNDMIEITITEAIAWDGHLNRATESAETNERFKVVFLKDGVVVGESPWTGESVSDDGLPTGATSAYWSGALGETILLPNGADQILLVHWADTVYASNNSGSRNKVFPASICIEFGQRPATVGDRVWFDNDGDGMQDAGEAGIPDVTVNLTDCAGNVLASDVTDANGNYLFDGLAAGTYCVVIDETTLPGNVTQTFEKDGSLDGNTEQPLAAGESVLDVDFGYRPQQATVGDRVWFDNDGDGVQDTGEAGIPDVTVNLTDCAGNVLASDVTDANGNYLFDGLAAGTYCVVIDETTLPGNVTQTFEKDGSLDGDTEQTLAAGDGVLDVDFGYQPLGSIGDTVFEDLNNNGIQDAGESGIPGVTVDLTCAGPDTLFGTADDIIASDVTDANGNYLFTDLPAGVCEVNPDENTVPAGYELTTNNDPETVDLGPGEEFLDADFGYRPPTLSLGDRVWYDQNQDGIQDANEPGYNGATVDLYDNGDCAGVPVASTTTAVGPAGFGDGFYQFSGLSAGTYCVQFGNIPAGWSISPANQTGDTADSDANEFAQIPNISLTDNDPDEDMGIFVDGSLGDSVVCASTGLGLANITVSLLADFDGNGLADGPAIASTETDATGFYQFTGLEVALAGDPNNTTAYIVQVDSSDADLGSCNVPDGPTEYNPELDSDMPDDPNNDFSFTEQPATVGDRVWFDNDGDGVQDAGEAGIPNVTVNLTDCSGNILASDVTDANGNYLFDGLMAGTYCVVIDETTLPGNVTQTFEKDGSLDGDTEQSLAAGDVVLDVDFGYLLQLATVGDRVWFDNDADGVQDAGEAGIPGVTVNLTDCAGIILASDVTDANGNYLFDGLMAGTYCVVIDETTLPGNVTQTFEKDGSLDGDTEQTLAAGDAVLDVDFGYQPLGSIGDTVFEDPNNNGVQDAGEPGIPGVTVILNDPGADGVCGTADDTFITGDVTDGNGNYLFSGLAEGTYCVDPNENTVPTGYELTTNNDPETVDLGPGEDFLDADFGYRPQQATVGDRVWFDNDGDGVQDAGEAGIPDVTVNLTDCAGNILASDVTDANGNYLFDGLAAGAYCVVIDETSLPGNVTQTFEKDGSLDGDTEQSLAAGDVVLDVDFGYLLQLATVGDRVWFDNDADGVQDAGEAGIPDVTVNLTDCSGNVLASDVTDANGNYLFDGLMAGTYCVVIDETTLPGNVAQTFEKDGSLDGDTEQPLAAGESVLDVDFGYAIIAIGLEKYTRIEVNQVGGDLCDTYDKPQLLTMLYTGDNINDNMQDASKVVIAGDPLFTPTVRILSTNDSNPTKSGARVWFDGIVNLNTPFTLDSTNAGEVDFDSSTYVYIYDLSGNLLQAIEFHTSCSQPLMLGDQFGGIQLIGFRDKNGAGEDLPQTTGFGEDADVPTGPTAVVGDTIIWTYIATNEGSAPLANITVTDDAGTPADASDDFSATAVLEAGFNVGDTNENGLLDVGEEWQFTASGTAVVGQYRNVGVASGTASGVTVSDDDPSHYLGEYSGADLCDTYGKPQLLTMLYTGDNINSNSQDSSKVVITGNPLFASPVRIVASEKSNGGGKIYGDAEVSVGDTFTIDARLPGDSELRSETWVTIYDLNGNVLQSIKFHTSCSQPLALGDQFGGIQLVGFQDKNGNGDGEIETPPPTAVDLCDTYGKPQILVMTYTGENVISHAQDPSKVVVTGDAAGTGRVQILVTDKENPADSKARVYFDGIVNLGEQFMVDANNAGENKLENATFVFIYNINGTLLQSIEFHTSCSQPLRLEDQFGSVQLVGFVDESGAVAGDTSGVQLPAPDICGVLGKPQILIMTYTGNNVLDNAQDSSKVIVTGNPNGEATVRILATDEANPADANARVYFDGIVNLGEQFMVDANNANENKLENATFIYVYDQNGNLLQSIEFHTSCSQPLRIGDQFGSAQLVGYVDENGVSADLP